MIQTISLNASLRDPADAAITLLKGFVDKFIDRPAKYLQGALVLGIAVFARSRQSVFVGGASCVSLQALKSTKALSPVGRVLFNAYGNYYLAYDSKYPSVATMMQKMEH